MRWFEYKMEVDDLHASDDLKAKLLAMQSQQAASVPAEKAVTRKQPEVPAHKKAVHFPSSRVWKGLAACAAFCVVAGVRLPCSARVSSGWAEPNRRVRQCSHPVRPPILARKTPFLLMPWPAPRLWPTIP